MGWVYNHMTHFVFWVIHHWVIWVHHIVSRWIHIWIIRHTLIWVILVMPFPFMGLIPGCILNDILLSIFIIGRGFGIIRVGLSSFLFIYILSSLLCWLFWAKEYPPEINKAIIKIPIGFGTFCIISSPKILFVNSV